MAFPLDGSLFVTGIDNASDSGSHDDDAGSNVVRLSLAQLHLSASGDVGGEGNATVVLPPAATAAVSSAIAAAAAKDESPPQTQQQQAATETAATAEDDEDDDNGDDDEAMERIAIDVYQTTASPSPPPHATQLAETPPVRSGAVGGPLPAAIVQPQPVQPVPTVSDFPSLEESSSQQPRAPKEPSDVGPAATELKLPQQQPHPQVQQPQPQPQAAEIPGQLAPPSPVIAATVQQQQQQHRRERREPGSSRARPLLSEFLPGAVVSQDTSSSHQQQQPQQQPQQQQQQRTQQYASADAEETPNRVLWVGNIGPTVTQETLLEEFSPFGEIESIKLLPQKWCAFVSFLDESCAITAKEEMHGQIIGGQYIRVKFRKHQPQDSQQQYQQQHHHHQQQQQFAAFEMDPQEERQPQRNPISRAVWVGNVGDDIAEEEFRRVASAYGQVESVKFLRQKHCAFINYMTEREAIAAVSGMKGMRLGNIAIKVNYGRPLPPPQSQMAAPGMGVFPPHGAMAPGPFLPFPAFYGRPSPQSGQGFPIFPTPFFDTMCPLCNANQRAKTFLPCSHGACIECFHKIGPMLGHEPHCPLCSTPIANVIDQPMQMPFSMQPYEMSINPFGAAFGFPFVGGPPFPFPQHGFPHPGSFPQQQQQQQQQQRQHPHHAHESSVVPAEASSSATTADTPAATAGTQP